MTSIQTLVNLDRAEFSTCSKLFRKVFKRKFLYNYYRVFNASNKLLFDTSRPIYSRMDRVGSQQSRQPLITVYSLYRTRLTFKHNSVYLSIRKSKTNKKNYKSLLLFFSFNWTFKWRRKNRAWIHRSVRNNNTRQDTVWKYCRCLKLKIIIIIIYYFISFVIV